MGYNFIYKNSKEFKEVTMIRWLPTLMSESIGLSWDVVYMFVFIIFIHYAYPRLLYVRNSEK